MKVAIDAAGRPTAPVPGGSGLDRWASSPAISRTTCTTVCRAAEPAAMGEGAQHSHSALAN